jgi:hypothetical protein
MKLVEVVSNLASYDEELTIYAKEPWTCDSEAILAYESDAGGVPPEATGTGATYFIEVFIANEFLDGWRNSQQRAVTAQEQCERLIQYAIHDA